MIHPTAQIESGARIGKGTIVGPYCIIGGNVTIGDNCRLIAHVHVTGQTTIGAGTVIYPFASLGTPPQSLGFRGTLTRLEIGAGCDIRESVTMNAGSEDGGGITKVGDNGFFMANSHVAHDCIVGNNVVFANCATLGGHCVVGDFVFIGGITGVHQFTRIGRHAMIAGASGLRSDVIPFGLAGGAFARLSGINVLGMKRRGFGLDSVRAVRSAYRMIFLGDGDMPARLAEAEAKFPGEEAVAEIVSFIRNKGKRPICQPGRHADAE
ncbi:MAG TPA: acyl-ACP--UDP-N-acetylglucosamine O-acyltransferase [Pseudolabrys sp.]|nr:acyl-ACP--UDP-N-acetylglucosamine O-acyltransferase [Pseudolabrys sp.]